MVARQIQQDTEYSPTTGLCLIVKDTARIGGFTATIASLVVANTLGMGAQDFPVAPIHPIYASTGIMPALAAADSNRISFSGVSFGELAQLLFPAFRELTPEESAQHSDAFGSFFS